MTHHHQSICCSLFKTITNSEGMKHHRANDLVKVEEYAEYRTEKTGNKVLGEKTPMSLG